MSRHVRIAKTFDFDAANFLPLVPYGHKCRRLHGHTYRVEVICEGPLDARGMVLDYAEIAERWEVIEAQLDHRYLNEVPGLENPTTEALALWIVDRLTQLPQLVAVRVYESATTYCESLA